MRDKFRIFSNNTIYPNVFLDVHKYQYTQHLPVFIHSDGLRGYFQEYNIFPIKQIYNV